VNGDILLLWTGGWDSTFRLCWALVVESRTVQPYYVVERDRASTSAERQAMEAIRERLRETHPAAASLLRPLIVHQVDELLPNPRITEAYDRIRQRAFIGSQYVWLARMCDQFGLAGLELGVEWGGKAHALLQGKVGVRSPDEPRKAVLDAYRETDEYVVFGQFLFPVFDLSKLEIKRMAEERGLIPLLELTWFCHSPLRDGSPCGRCSPCVSTILDGLGERLPWKSRLRYHLRITARLRQLLMKYPTIHNRLRKLRRQP
jgi:hypothetical protein